jgi:ribonuclease HI
MADSLLPQVTIYTDGGADPNPGTGGWAAVLIDPATGKVKELSGGEARTTNNRMELTAAIRGLEALKEPCVVTLFSDSQYVINGIAKGWARGWRAKAWRRQGGKTVPNWELWDRLLDLCDHHRVTLRWVEGHAGHTENERCDELAVLAAAGQDLPADPGYESPPAPGSV